MTKWSISARTVTGGNFGSALAGCSITANDAGTAYQFLANDGSLLATSAGSTLPTGAFDFPVFIHSGPTYGIHVSSLTTTQAKGSWTASAGGTIKDTDPENGEWTAQAGAGGHPDPDEDAGTNAASASV